MNIRPTTILLMLVAAVAVGAENRATGDKATGDKATDKQAVRIVVGFEGSCPRSLKGVKREGPNRFRIFPSWRSSPGIGEDAVGRSTSLGFKVVNTGPSAQPVELLIDWQYHDAPSKGVPRFAGGVDEYMSYRDFVVVRGPGEKSWRTVMVDVDDSVGELRLNVATGETEIHWHPPYTYTQSEKFVDSLRKHPLVRVEDLGKSKEGRIIRLLRITDDSPRAKKPVLIHTRLHAYESASSYVMEGMVGWLLSGEPYAAEAVREYVFHVYPMMNPDGVFNGLGKHNAPAGNDLQFLDPELCPEQRVIKETIDRVRPVVFIDLHNWQNKHTDGLLYLEPALRERFMRYMPDQLAFGKKWVFRDLAPLPEPPAAREVARRYCRRMLDPVMVTFEFPWFGRTTDDMRATGRKAIWALLRALDEPASRGTR